VDSTVFRHARTDKALINGGPIRCFDLSAQSVLHDFWSHPVEQQIRTNQDDAPPPLFEDDQKSWLAFAKAGRQT